MQFPAFNGLRFIAAAAVVCVHYADTQDRLRATHPFLSNLIQSGPGALGFFFILSGFVLAHASQGRDIRPRPFWRARFARLYPVYLLAFLLFLPVGLEKYLRLAHSPGTFLAAGVANLTLLQSWTPYALSWNGPSWSLSDEALFYALFPFLYAPIMRARPARLIVITGTTWIAELCLFAAHADQRIPEPVWHRWIQYNPIYWLPLFVLGIALYRTHRAWLECPGWLASSVSLAACAATLGLALTVNPMTREYLESGGLAPILLLLVLSFSHPGNRLAPLLGGRILTLLGGASYAAYILQAPIAHYTDWVSGKFHATQPERFALICVCLLIFSVSVHLYLEQPAQRYIVNRNRA